MAAFLLALMLAGGGPTTDSAIDYVYACDGMGPVVAWYFDSKATLRIGQREIDLPQVISASGARYSDGRIVFWIKGREAVLDSGDGEARKCRVMGRG